MARKRIDGTLDINTAGIEYAKTQSERSSKIIYEFVYRVSRSYCLKYKMVNQTDEITSRSMHKIVTRIHQFDIEKGKFFNWVYGIVHNEVRLYIRKEKFYSKNVEIGNEEYGEGSEYTAFVEPSEDPPEVDEVISFNDVLIALEDFKHPKISTERDRKFGHIYKDLFKDLYVNGIKQKEIVKKYDIPYGLMYTIRGDYREAFADYLKKRYSHKLIPQF